MRIRPRIEFRSIDYSLVNIRKYIDLGVNENPIAINELFENNLISNMD